MPVRFRSVPWIPNSSGLLSVAELQERRAQNASKLTAPRPPAKGGEIPAGFYSKTPEGSQGAAVRDPFPPGTPESQFRK